MKTPRIFALVDDAENDHHVIGYGMTLPDGSAVSVSWPSERGVSYYSSSTAEDNAALRGADLVWMPTGEGA
jgi:hypothetical protein